jgi:hypothetical protein
MDIKTRIVVDTSTVAVRLAWLSSRIYSLSIVLLKNSGAGQLLAPAASCVAIRLVSTCSSKA